MPSIELIFFDYQGIELDPMVEQVSQEFLSDDNFVKSIAFYQFGRRENIQLSEERCNKMKFE